MGSINDLVTHGYSLTKDSITKETDRPDKNEMETIMGIRCGVLGTGLRR